MKLTIITEDNWAYFAGVLVGWWDQRSENLLLVGLLDDRDVAVGALVVELEGPFARLKHIGIDPRKQGCGHGAFLLRGLRQLLQTTVVTNLHCIVYLQQEDPATVPPPSALQAVPAPVCLDRDEGRMVSFLARNGFTFHDLALRRCVYRLGQLQDAPLPTAPHPCVKRYDQLSMQELGSLSDGARAMDRQVLTLHQGLYTDPTDRLSRFWTEDGAVLAMAHCAQESDGVRLDAIYAKNGHLPKLTALYGAILTDLTGRYPPDTAIYIDTAGQKLLDYQAHVLGCPPSQCRCGYAAACAI